MPIRSSILPELNLYSRNAIGNDLYRTVQSILQPAYVHARRIAKDVDIMLMVWKGHCILDHIVAQCDRYVNSYMPALHVCMDIT